MPKQTAADKSDGDNTNSANAKMPKVSMVISLDSGKVTYQVLDIVIQQGFLDWSDAIAMSDIYR